MSSNFLYYTTQIMSQVELNPDGSIKSSRIVSQWTRQTGAPKKKNTIKKPKGQLDAVGEETQIGYI